MARDCSRVPTSTLYGQLTSTIVSTKTFTTTTTLVGGIVDTSTSYEYDTILSTQNVPISTQFATQCNSAITTSTPKSGQQGQSTSTFQSSYTQNGGQVIVQTIIQTYSRNGSVVIETQTAAPNPIQTTSFHSTETHKTNPGPIAGGIVGGVAVLAILIGLIWFLRKKKRNAMASRNLDEFFADPSTMDWDEKNGNGNLNGTSRLSRSGSMLGLTSGAAGAAAGGTTSRGGTLRSIKRSSMAILDLEKDKGVSENDKNHWAALTRIDSAQLDEEREMEEARSAGGHGYGRPQSRQSLNALDRPLSFHSMSIGHGLTSPQAFIMSSDITPENESFGANQVLLRNDSDNSSKSANSPTSLSKIQTRSMDMLPSFLSSASPPLSPTSPYGSPPLRDLPLREGVPFSSTNEYGQTDQRPSISRGPRFSSNNSNISMTAAAAAAAAGTPVSGIPTTMKARTWSTGTFNVPERPKSALGLSGQASPPFTAVFSGNNQVIHQSPPVSPTLIPVQHSGSPPDQYVGQQIQSDLQRGRASLNGGTPQYPNIYSRGGSKRYSYQSNQSPHSPQSTHNNNTFISSSSSPQQQQYPPSQYAHLDVYKTEEERAEDRMHAMNKVQGGGGMGMGTESQNYPSDRQRRHRSLSGALLLQATNGESSSNLTYSTPKSEFAMTPNPSSGVERNPLSVRNVDSKNSKGLVGQ